MGALVEGNTIEHVGLRLASVGGIFCSACSNTTLRGNTVRYSPRWGVAIRSQSPGGPADSQNNLVERNRLRFLGLATKDFGGISPIAYEGAPGSNSTIRYNCVRDVIGVDTTKHGVVSHWRRPYMSYGIYLDNEASGYATLSNVIRTNDRAGVFFHLGSANVVQSNVLVNSTNADGAGGQWEVADKEGYSRHNAQHSRATSWPSPRRLRAASSTPARRSTRATSRGASGGTSTTRTAWAAHGCGPGSTRAA